MNSMRGNHKIVDITNCNEYIKEFTNELEFEAIKNNNLIEDAVQFIEGYSGTSINNNAVKVIIKEKVEEKINK